jgi:hypothetical protein
VRVISTRLCVASAIAPPFRFFWFAGFHESFFASKPTTEQARFLSAKRQRTISSDRFCGCAFHVRAILVRKMHERRTHSYESQLAINAQPLEKVKLRGPGSLLLRSGTMTHRRVNLLKQLYSGFSQKLTKVSPLSRTLGSTDGQDQDACSIS